MFLSKNEEQYDTSEAFQSIIEFTIACYSGPLVEINGEWFPDRAIIVLFFELWGAFLDAHAMDAGVDRLCNFGQPLSRWVGPDPDDPILNDDLHVD